MRQAILYGAGDLRLEQRSLHIDHLDPHQIYVETEVTALSTGTDLGNYQGHSTDLPSAPDYPRAVGYSNVGVVRAVGSSVVAFRQGQRLFSRYPHQSAFLARDNELLVPLPKEVSSEEASLTYLTQLGLAALRQARYETGENVAIVGLGVIGLCTVNLARAMGARVVAISNSPIRSEGSRRVGAHAAFESNDPQLQEKLSKIFGQIGADLIILTANTWPAYRLSVQIARHGTRLSVLGFPGRGQPPPDFNPLDPEWFYGKQLVLLGAGHAPETDCPPPAVRFNLRRNLEYILHLMASKELQLSSLITHRLPASRMREAYELARKHSKELIAAVFFWNPKP